MLNLAPSVIKEILTTGKYVSPEDGAKIDASNPDLNSFLDKLISSQTVSKDLLGQAIAEYYKVGFQDLSSANLDRAQITKLPENVARKYNALLISDDGSSVNILTDDPASDGLRSELKQLFPNQQVVFYFALPEQIESLFVNYLKPLETRFAKIIAQAKHVAPEIFDEILTDASAYKASDIHLEPKAKEVVVRFRIDGVLHEAGRLPKEFYENILNRIKIQSKLRIDEHFAPQDGAIRYELNQHNLAMRVSIVPSLDGENTVIRLLSEYVRSFSLEDLGLTTEDHSVLLEAAKRPFGMVLVTGPTGSGKTTTLYSLLNLISSPEVSVTTIEDPVEYKMVNINQIQVDPKTDLTFAKGLKSILRQDPDIILVGEIRDKETAEIAVNAALTGHLLFSTFHANDAATAIPRLLDIGVEPFLVASTVELIIAQRLVRKICTFCKVSKNIDPVAMEKVLPNFSTFFSAKDTLYEGKGCDHCRGTKFSGRVGVFEFIRVSKEMKDLVLKNPSSVQIWELAKRNGSKSLFEDGLVKVRNGITTLEELLRVVPIS